MSAIGGVCFALVLVAVGFSQPASAAPESAAPADQAEAAAPVPAKTLQEQFDDIWARDQLTGDWGGWRTELHDHGIDVQLRLTQYAQWVASGGVHKDGEYGGTLDYRVNADLNKLFGLWSGLSVSMHARTRFGQDVNADAGAFALQNTGLLMPSPATYHGTDVTGVMVSQLAPLFAGRLLNVAVGMIDVIDTVSLLFPWVGYGQEGFWNVNGMVTALPWFGAVRGLSLYGGWAITINEEHQDFETGFLFTGTENESTKWGSISDAYSEGAWLAGFHKFFWKLDDKPGWFMIFAGGSTREQLSNISLDFIDIPGGTLIFPAAKEKKPWDIAGYLYQVFWQAEDDPTRKATFIIGGTGGPDDPQFAQWHIFSAVEAYGPMACRPHDRMGVSGWYNGLSNKFVNQLAALPAPIRLRDTWGFELYYNFAINKWLHLSPDLQIIQNEIKGDNVAVIPGLRLVVDF